MKGHGMGIGTSEDLLADYESSLDTGLDVARAVVVHGRNIPLPEQLEQARRSLKYWQHSRAVGAVANRSRYGQMVKDLERRLGIDHGGNGKVNGNRLPKPAKKR